MRIRKKRSTTVAVVLATDQLGNVCNWCGEAIDPSEGDGGNLEERGLSLPSVSGEKARTFLLRVLVLTFLCSFAQPVDSHASLRCSSLPPPSCTGGDDSKSSAAEEAAAGTPMSQLLRMVFAQTPNASLTPRQALARMMISGLCGGEEPALVLEQVATTMSTDPYFLQLKRGRFRVRNNADEMDDGTLPVPQTPRAIPKTLRLLDGLPDLEPADVQGVETLCSCKNGNGWKCSQKAKPGYLLCEHHLDLNFRRKMRRVSRMKDELTSRMKQKSHYLDKLS
ncbi:uncharacterized protein LOC9631955 [Selaginella moellendorffii]|uniref:uncharacterized protein LOC9631955 n=1 Tax=Selaginella moellendorffii TaxID=88036 RepID=UPI000D1CF814|nr:uncharacterized protein LOC9631955 [Selaginella moellendorffii]|eukprot:XP_024530968.1 uncharacterized protein LOC9631955 [Selaginella moellendorffii]